MYIYTTGRCTCAPLHVRGDPCLYLYTSHTEGEKTRKKIAAEGTYAMCVHMCTTNTMICLRFSAY